MKIEQYHFTNEKMDLEIQTNSQVQLVLAFGNRNLIQQNSFARRLEKAFPQAEVIGCSTSGEIFADDVYDDTLVVTAIQFEATPIEVCDTNLSLHANSLEAGLALATSLSKEDLKYVLVISDGHLVNGTELVAGLTKGLPEKVLITGGMAGDADRFQETIVWHNGVAESGKITICGFYGDSIRIGHGTLGGWTSFGPERTITRAEGNVLYELDDQPALELYKQYLGSFSEQLPSSALRFPLNLQLADETQGVVRTILDINEEQQSMTFAGDMPVGATAKLMKANYETLIEGANGAAVSAIESLDNQAQLALLISCVGRRLVLGQRVFEELEAVVEVVGKDCPVCGFYSYGEISPLVKSTQCKLHNQTMTITTFCEK